MVTSSSRAGALGFLISAVLFVALLSPHIPAVKARVLTQFQSPDRATDTLSKGEDLAFVSSAPASRALLQFDLDLGGGDDLGGAESDDGGDSGSGDYDGGG